MIYDICIIGGGPAAHSSAVYCSRSMLETILFEGSVDQGGQLIQTTHVENYPGFPEGIMGYDLCTKFREHSEKWGTTILSEFVSSISYENDNKVFVVYYGENGEKKSYILCKSIILATGSKAKSLLFQNSELFWNRGITGCAVCHGALPMFRNKPLFVVGGGDTAMEDALFLSRYSKQVYIIHRREQFRASKIMQQRVLSNPNITVLWNSEVVCADGNDNLESVSIMNNKTGDISQYKASGLFYAIGHSPSTDFLKNSDISVNMDEEGYILTYPDSTKTSVKGIFAAGDVRASDKKFKQAIVASGTGCKAALEAIDYVDSL